MQKRLLIGFYTVLFFSAIILFNQVFAAEYYVSRNGNDAGGESWDSAWTDFNKINWNKIAPGDTIYIDGGKSSMTYYSTLKPEKSGQRRNLINIVVSDESGRDGIVKVFGGRTTSLPECGTQKYKFQTTFTHPDGQTKNITNHGIDLRNVSYISVDGGEWEGIHVYGHNHSGISFDSETNHIRLSNIKIYENGYVKTNNNGKAVKTTNDGVTGIHPDGPGIRIAGRNHILNKLNIHDNGQDAIQSAAGENNLANLKLRNSWLHNERAHSMTGPGTPVNNSPNYSQDYPIEAFNWCKHTDAIQIYSGGEVSGFDFTNNIFGPGFVNTFMLGETGSAGPAYLTNFTLKNSLLLFPSGMNLNSKAPGLGADNWLIENVTAISTNSHSYAINLQGTNHTVKNSVFYDGSIRFEEGSNSYTFSGNCEFNVNPNMDTFGNLVEDPQFKNLNKSKYFSSKNFGDFTVNNPNCSGSSITKLYDITQKESDLPVIISSSGGSGGGGSKSIQVNPVNNNFTDMTNHTFENYVLRCKEGGFCNGFSDETFRPDNTLLRKETFTLIRRSFGIIKGGGTATCIDTKEADVHQESLEIMLSHSLILPDENGQCRPNNQITRGEMVSIIYKIMNATGRVDANQSFNYSYADLERNPYTNQIAWLSNQKANNGEYVVVGYQENGQQVFGWNSGLTRGQFVKIMMNSKEI